MPEVDPESYFGVAVAAITPLALNLPLMTGDAFAYRVFMAAQEALSQAIMDIEDRINARMSTTADKFKADVFQVVLRAYYLHLRKHVGLRTFEVRKPLAQMLAQTDVPDYSVSFLRPPFEYIQIIVPPGIFEAPLENVQKIYVYKIKEDKKIGVNGIVGDSNFNIYIPVDDDKKTIRELVAERKDSKIDGVSEEYATKMGIYNPIKTDVFSFTVNCLLYATSANADISKSPEVKKLHKKLNNTRKKSKREAITKRLQQAKDIHILGANFVARKELTTDLTLEGRKLTKRFRVRGFFRRPPHGDVKNVWVQPHWRGPTFAELVEKGYVVTTHKEEDDH